MSSFDQLEQYFKKACDSGQLAGGVATVASRNHLIWQHSFGHRQLGGQTAMTPDSLFWIASLTKAVTTLAALQLVERGLLALDAPVGALVPELAGAQVLDGFDALGSPKLRPARSDVTLRQLLTHTSGLGYEMWDAGLKAWMAKTGTPGMGSGRLAALKVPLLKDPGCAWAYGTGIDFAGRAVEAASGLALDDYFAAHIFGPLGLRDTGFVCSPEQKTRRAVMHRRRPEGSLVPISFETGPQPEFFSGGGGLYSTAPDYVRFLQMILRGGEGLLRPETLALMRLNQIGSLAVSALATAMPAATRDVEFWPPMDRKWTFGFMLNPQAVPGGRGAGSLAWAGLGNCYYWVDPAQDRIGLLMLQVLPFFDPDCLTALELMERSVHAH